MPIIIGAAGSSGTGVGGTCTLANIRESVYARGYDSDIATTVTAVINDVYAEIAGDHPWDWLEAQSTAIVATIGDPSYALSTIADLATVQAVRVQAGTDFYDLVYQDTQELEAELHMDRANGIPTRWTRRAGEILLYPRPERAYTLVVDYIKDPPALVADSDSPLFPATYCPILVYGALAELAARTRDWAQHDRHRARYGTLLSRMKTRTGVQQQQSSLQVGRSGMFDDAQRSPATWGY